MAKEKVTHHENGCPVGRQQADSGIDAAQNWSLVTCKNCLKRQPADPAFHVTLDDMTISIMPHEGTKDEAEARRLFAREVERVQRSQTVKLLRDGVVVEAQFAIKCEGCPPEKPHCATCGHSPTCPVRCDKGETDLVMDGVRGLVDRDGQPRKRPPFFDLIVENIGTVYRGPDEQEARTNFDHYLKRSKEQEVTLMRDGEIIDNFDPHTENPSRKPPEAAFVGPRFSGSAKDRRKQRRAWERQMQQAQ